MVNGKANEISEKLIELLSRCGKVEVTGELARGEKEINMIELIISLRYAPDFTDLILKCTKEKIFTINYNGALEKKLFYKVDDLYAPLKIYCANEKNYGLIKLFTTGDARFVKYIVRQLKQKDIIISDWEVKNYPIPLRSVLKHKYSLIEKEVPEEANVFKLAGIPYVEPKDRKDFPIN